MSSQVASLWHNRDFLLLLWSGRGISVLGVGISNISWPLLVWVITHSSAQAGFVSATPNLVLGFPAGAFIDRWNRKLILICCDTARFLAFGSVPLAVALGSLSIALLYIVALVEETANSFFCLEGRASLLRIVLIQQLSRANVINQSANALGIILGLGNGGFIISLAQSIIVGAGLAFLVDSISYLVSVISPTLSKLLFKLSASCYQLRLLQEITEGIRFSCFIVLSLRLSFSALFDAVVMLYNREFLIASSWSTSPTLAYWEDWE